MSADLDVLKDIPGYKAILKSVLKTQIQLLVEQLSDHTGEESIILTASVNDGSLSHLGSCTGKGFLEGRDEIKSQFLGYCLKSHHRKKSQETTPQSPYERSGGPPPRSSPSIPGPRMAVHQSPTQPAKRPRIHPVSMARISAPGSRGSPSAAGDQTFGASRNVPASPVHVPDRRTSVDAGGDRTIKVEAPSVSQGGDNSFSDSISSTPTSFPSTLQLSRTQSVADMAGDSDHNFSQKEESNESSGEAEPSSVSNIKVEPITEGEMELEITGVELGDGSQGPAENWGQDMAPGAHLYGTPGADGGPDLDSSTDQSGYSVKYLATNISNRPQKQHQCIVCGLVSYSESAARIHARVHSGARPFTCDVCQRSFSRHANLSRHQRLHSGEKYFCEICNKPFVDQYSVKMHMRSVHDVLC